MSREDIFFVKLNVSFEDVCLVCSWLQHDVWLWSQHNGHQLNDPFFVVCSFLCVGEVFTKPHDLINKLPFYSYFQFFYQVLTIIIIIAIFTNNYCNI